MPNASSVIWLGDSITRANGHAVGGEFVTLHGEQFYRITHYENLPPFFMSIVSSSDHWLFVSSSGGLTAGRANADSALFPYYTDDKVAEGCEQTGPKTIALVSRGPLRQLWEPFSARYAGLYRIERRLYKNLYGNKLLFEEINHDLGLAFCYAWQPSPRYGFVKTAWLQNRGETACAVTILDGLQNLLPYGANSGLQNTFSNLLDAYKRAELEPSAGLAIFSLSATLTDQAEPSESLRATTVWQTGLSDTRYLLSSAQLDKFRRGQPICEERDVRGRRGAFFACATLELAAGAQREWSIVAEINQDSAAVIGLLGELQAEPAELAARLRRDAEQGSADLMRLVASADGLQHTGDQLSSARQLANVLFNIMRGGVFADGYAIDTADLREFLAARNRPLLRKQRALLESLPARIELSELRAHAASGSRDLERLCYEYLPLTFSRRHGDPSRPWNRFSINLRRPDGARRLDYEGNWRDIFQNWEALAFSYPEFAEGMIYTFLNATTADGYNPYRVTRAGVEWERPDPASPWANIGYWSDHQIIYLAKLLEAAERFHPGQLAELLSRPIFTHAHVPYRIKPYDALLEDWYSTIEFDWPLEARIGERVAALGGDGRLLHDAEGRIVYATLAEKLLTLLLAKLVNLVPEGGIWMNTQRPEWNDANNALVGKGLSVVTVAYLRRMLVLCRRLFAASRVPRLAVAAELAELFHTVGAALEEHQPALEAGFDDAQRHAAMDSLGRAGSAYRERLYAQGRSGAQAALGAADVIELLDLALRYADQTLRANARDDALFHTYNILRLGPGRAAIGRLDTMLEGQVAILSAGMLAPEQALALLHSLRRSPLFRADQHSYLLYPDRDLPGFLGKNRIRPEQLRGLQLARALAEAGDRSLLVRDAQGDYHFNGDVRNAKDVRHALEQLVHDERFAALVEADAEAVLELFEQTFQHSKFTGRSGTFFAYEGLGSIYWHMVAKLLLAVQENYFHAITTGAPAELLAGLAAAYDDIRQGLGFNKPPHVYGAFPTDPYSHTPSGQGAKQPGMTGQVKEEILTRLGELGVAIADGALAFRPTLLRAQEYTSQASAFHYVNIEGQAEAIELPAGALAFTFCQLPIVYQLGGEPQIEILLVSGATRTVAGSALDQASSQQIFGRTGQIRRLIVHIPAGR